MKFQFGLAVAGVLGMAAANVCGDDWPQWRGPARDGISKETGLLKEWPEGGPKLVWQNKEVGSGYGAPAVADGKVYLISNTGMDDEFVTAYSVTDGKKVWSTHIGGVGNPNQTPKYPAARSTPAIVGGVIYVMGSDGDLAALDKNGTIKWQKNVRKEFGGEPGVWAYAESPLIDGDAIVVAPGNVTGTLVKLKKDSGDLIWKSAMADVGQAGYASTILVSDPGPKQYVQVFQKSLVGVDANSGKQLWHYDRAAKGSPANIPTPVARKGIIYTAGARTGAGAVKLKATGDTVTAEELYFDTKLPAAIGGSVLVGDTLYGTSATGLQAVEFETGKVKWQDKSIGAASLLFADGRLYLHGEDGQVALVEASADGYHEKGKFTPPDAPPLKAGAKAWAYPALANGKLYVRRENSLWSFDVKGK